MTPTSTRRAATPGEPARRSTSTGTGAYTAWVAHWGHIHRRLNEYRAVYSVQHDGRSWKIAGVDVREHSRVEEDG